MLIVSIKQKKSITRLKLSYCVCCCIFLSKRDAFNSIMREAICKSGRIHGVVALPECLVDEFSSSLILEQFGNS